MRYICGQVNLFHVLCGILCDENIYFLHKYKIIKQKQKKQTKTKIIICEKIFQIAQCEHKFFSKIKKLITVKNCW